MKRASEHFYEFGDFRFDLETCVLFRENEVVKLKPKALEILRVLIENGEQVVSKADLLASVWPDSFVEEANLSHHIFRLRQALGTANGAKFIETIPKRGYRFVAAASQNGSPAVADHSRVPFNGAAAGEASPAASKRHWFVLFAAALSLIAVTGLAAYRVYLSASTDSRNMRGGKSDLPRMTIVPLTSFPNDEFDSALSPDGKYTAFAWFGTENESLQVYVKQTDAGEPLRLSTNGIRDRDGAPAWSPDGRFIAYTRMSLDSSRSGVYVVPALGGAERRLVRADDLGAGLDWSGDGKTLVFSSRNSKQEPHSLHLLNFETLETHSLTSPPAQTDGDVRPDFSPDSQTISFTRTYQESGDLYITDLSGDTRRLTNDNRKIVGAAWTPDARSIVFSSNRGGAFSLWRLDTGEPGHMTPLEINAERAFDPSISRTGNRLSFTQIQRDTNIWRYPRRKSVQSQVPTEVIGSTRRELMPNYSPDGTKIAYVSDISGTYEIWSSNADGSGPIQLTRFDGGMTLNPHWSPDGMNIVFEARPEGRSQIYVTSLDGGTPRLLTSDSANSLAASYSGDGKCIYYSSDKTGTMEIWKMAAAGGDDQQITHNGGSEVFESNDGQKLYFTKPSTLGIFEVSLADPAEERLLVSDQLFEGSGEWTVTPEGIYIAQHHYETQNKKPAIDLFSFETGKIRTVLEMDKDFGSYAGINASPDGQWLIFSREDVRNHDISLVENFQ